MTEFSHPRRRVALWTLCGALLAAPAPPARARAASRSASTSCIPGQRLTTIAKRYKVSVDAIRMANGLEQGRAPEGGRKAHHPGPRRSGRQQSARALSAGSPDGHDRPRLDAQRQRRQRTRTIATRRATPTTARARTRCTPVSASNRSPSATRSRSMRCARPTASRAGSSCTPARCLNIPRPGDRIGAKTDDDDATTSTARTSCRASACARATSICSRTRVTSAATRSTRRARSRPSPRPKCPSCSAPPGRTQRRIPG